MADTLTWKEVKREYLLILIKQGDLSNSQLDELIREAQHMTSDKGNISGIGIVNDMRHVVEVYKEAI